MGHMLRTKELNHKYRSPPKNVKVKLYIASFRFCRRQKMKY